jgi:hypothetical protein
VSARRAEGKFCWAVYAALGNFLQQLGFTATPVRTGRLFDDSNDAAADLYEGPSTRRHNNIAINGSTAQSTITATRQSPTSPAAATRQAFRNFLQGGNQPRRNPRRRISENGLRDLRREFEPQWIANGRPGTLDGYIQEIQDFIHDGESDLNMAGKPDMPILVDSSSLVVFEHYLWRRKCTQQRRLNMY